MRVYLTAIAQSTAQEKSAAALFLRAYALSPSTPYNLISASNDDVTIMMDSNFSRGKQPFKSLCEALPTAQRPIVTTVSSVLLPCCMIHRDFCEKRGFAAFAESRSCEVERRGRGGLAHTCAGFTYIYNFIHRYKIFLVCFPSLIYARVTCPPVIFLFFAALMGVFFSPSPLHSSPLPTRFLHLTQDTTTLSPPLHLNQVFGLPSVNVIV